MTGVQTCALPIKDISILRKELIEAAKINRESAGVGSLDAVKKMIKKEEKKD